MSAMHRRRFDIPPPRLLVVEDDRVQAALAEGTIAKIGFDVAVALNLTDALKLLNDQEFEVIVSDLFLPETNGVATVRALRNTRFGGRARVLAYTAHDDSDTLGEVIRSGYAEDVLHKTTDGPAGLVEHLRPIYAELQYRSAKDAQLVELEAEVKQALEAVVQIGARNADATAALAEEVRGARSEVAEVRAEVCDLKKSNEDLSQVLKAWRAGKYVIGFLAVIGVVMQWGADLLSNIGKVIGK